MLSNCWNHWKNILLMKTSFISAFIYWRIGIYFFVGFFQKAIILKVLSKKHITLINVDYNVRFFFYFTPVPHFSFPFVILSLIFLWMYFWIRKHWLQRFCEKKFNTKNFLSIFFFFFCCFWFLIIWTNEKKHIFWNNRN